MKTKPIGIFLLLFLLALNMVSCDVTNREDDTTVEETTTLDKTTPREEQTTASPPEEESTTKPNKPQDKPQEKPIQYPTEDELNLHHDCDGFGGTLLGVGESVDVVIDSNEKTATISLQMTPEEVAEALSDRYTEVGFGNHLYYVLKATNGKSVVIDTLHTTDGKITEVRIYDAPQTPNKDDCVKIQSTMCVHEITSLLGVPTQNTTTSYVCSEHTNADGGVFRLLWRNHGFILGAGIYTTRDGKSINMDNINQNHECDHNQGRVLADGETLKVVIRADGTTVEIDNRWLINDLRTALGVFSEVGFTKGFFFVLKSNQGEAVIISYYPDQYGYIEYPEIRVYPARDLPTREECAQVEKGMCIHDVVALIGAPITGSYTGLMRTQITTADGDKFEQFWSAKGFITDMEFSSAEE